MGRVTSRPRSRSPVIRSVTRVAFSVEPSSSASGCLAPSMPMPSATTQVCSPKCTPSTMNATRSRSSRPAAHQLGQRGLGRGDEPARHRRLASRRRPRPPRPARPAPARGRSGATTGPASIFSSASWPRISVRGEQVIGRQVQLPGPVGGPHPGPGHRHPAPAQGDRPGLGAVPVPGPLRVVPAVRPAQPRPRPRRTSRPSPAGRCRRPGPAGPPSPPRRSRPSTRSPAPGTATSPAAGQAGHGGGSSGRCCSRRSLSFVVFLAVHPSPTTRQAPGGGPPLSSSTKAGTSSPEGMNASLLCLHVLPAWEPGHMKLLMMCWTAEMALASTVTLPAPAIRACSSPLRTCIFGRSLCASC